MKATLTFKEKEKAQIFRESVAELEGIEIVSENPYREWVVFEIETEQIELLFYLGCLFKINLQLKGL